MDCGESLAKDFGDAHECDLPSSHQSAKDMDIHNNAVGRSIATNNSNATELELVDLICNKLESGELKILEDETDLNSAIINSDGCTCN